MPAALQRACHQLGGVTLFPEGDRRSERCRIDERALFLAACLRRGWFWGLSACTNRYDPVRRASAAACSVAAIGAPANRVPLSARRSAVGVVGGAATTLPPPGYYAYPGD